MKGKRAKRATGKSRLSHVDAKGEARMVDVSGKPPTAREAVARGWLQVSREALRAVRDNALAKGDLLAVARLAGIQAAKETASLIPLCHPLPLEHIEVEARVDEETSRINLEATARTRWATGVEMEALTAVAVAGLTAYDMIKAVDRTAVLSGVRLVKKSGGRSGAWQRRAGKD
ncbi:MAG TPA: cyclic pyranopterin monophosphate synthase MoaC [Candidatus Saccharimonadales bacterium]|nr:cyclic pyranopterin monophosphate synthase MoaC [Candidatus Saccharimonadales bacterium]